jgi:hypothetical protein
MGWFDDRLDREKVFTVDVLGDDEFPWVSERRRGDGIKSRQEAC